MTGGVVIEVADVPGRLDILFVDCVDLTMRRTSAIYVQLDTKSFDIQIGDRMRWHGDKAYWTPQRSLSLTNPSKGIDYDIPIVKIGVSGLEHPSRKNAIEK